MAMPVVSGLWLLVIVFFASPLTFLLDIVPSDQVTRTILLAFAVVISLGFLNPLVRASEWCWLNAVLVGLGAAAVISRVFWERPDLGQLSGIPGWGLILAGVAMLLLGIAVWRSLGWIFGLAFALALAANVIGTSPSLTSALETGLGISLSVLWFSGEGILDVWFGIFAHALALFFIAALFFESPRVESALQTLFFGALARLTGRPTAALIPRALAGHLSMWLFMFFGVAAASEYFRLGNNDLLPFIAIFAVFWAFFLVQAAHFASYAVQRRFRSGGNLRSLQIWSALTTLSLGVLLYFSVTSLAVGNILNLALVLSASLMSSPTGNLLALVHNFVSLMLVYFGASLLWYFFAGLLGATKWLGLLVSSDVPIWWGTAAAGLLIILLSLWHRSAVSRGLLAALIDLLRYSLPPFVLCWGTAVAGLSPGLAAFQAALVAICLWISITLSDGAGSEDSSLHVFRDRLLDRLTLGGRLLTFGALGAALMGAAFTPSGLN